MLSGQTMFQYLKRKKKSIQNNDNSFTQFHHNNQNISPNRSTLDQKSKQKNNKNIFLSRTTNITNSVTPPRFNILDQQRKSNTRSFLKMISPLRNKSPITQGETDKSNKNSPINVKKTSIRQNNSSKKYIIQHVNQLRNVAEGLLKSGKFLKQKINFIFVELAPLLRHFENIDKSNIQRQLVQINRKSALIQAKLKTVQKYFDQFDVQTSTQMFNQFYKSFAQYINELQGNMLSDRQQYKNTIVDDLKRQKNQIINDLQQKLKKIERQSLNMTKKYNKLQSSYNQLNQKYNQNIQNQDKQLDNNLNKLLQQLKYTKQQNKMLLFQKNDLNQRSKILQQQRKQLIWQKQKYEQQYMKSLAQVKTQQQQFLLNQIMVLKRQFANDINQISNLHKIKEQQLNMKFKHSNVDIQKLKIKIQDLIQINKQAQQKNIQFKAQITKLKKQNQCLACDIHRLNQQLYQHWLALKDIKTLSCRLDSFYKFRKIYEELSFNQQLFL